MNSNIKKIIIIVCVVIVLIISVLLIHPLKRIRKNVIENEIVNFLNTGEVGDDLLPSEAEEYVYAIRKDDTNVHRIDEFIKYYVEYIEKCILVKQKKFYKNDIKEFFIQSTFKKIGVLSGFDNHFVDNIIEHISEQDIKDYEDKKLEERLIKDLEKKFEHKSKEKYEDWYLIGNTKRNIELHYGMYMIYSPNDRTNTNEFKEAISYRIKNINDIDYLPAKGGNKDIEGILVYKTNNDEIKQSKRSLQLRKVNNKLYYYIYMRSLFYNQTKEASIEIRQHDWDKERAEWEAMIEEKQLNKGTRNQVSEEVVFIPEFDKYKVDAFIRITKYDDDSSEIYFVGTKWGIENGEQKAIVRQYKLQYDDIKTKEEVLEKYLKDKEHHDADEEFFKENNVRYNDK